MDDKLVGQKFNYLRVLKDVGKIGKGQHIYYKCLCDCGAIKIIRKDHIISGKTQSCGCYAIKIRRTHNMSKTRFYSIWRDMRRRCLDIKDAAYKDYGGRGITVCESWLKFENFMDDMYESYLEHVELHGEKDTTLDRVDVNGNYYKGNCKWATREVQQSNARRNKLFKAISPDGIEYKDSSVRRFGRQHNICYHSILRCLHGKQKKKTHKGWYFEYI